MSWAGTCVGTRRRAESIISWHSPYRLGIQQHAGQLEIGVGIVDAVARGVSQMLDRFVRVAGEQQHAGDPALNVGIVGSDVGRPGKKLAGPLVVPVLAGLAGFLRETNRFVRRVTA